MKSHSTAIAAYRHFSSKASAKAPKWTHNKNINKNKVDDPKTPTRTRIKWTDEQSQVLDAISSGKSVFITGSAGTGKSFLLQHIITRLKKLHHRSRVFATASTGVAACAIKGQTLHSFAGIGGEDDRQTLLHKVISNRGAYRRWTRARALVIDEISMVDAETFDTLEFIAREVRGGEEPDSEKTVWGGIQLVVSGDFFQLPPIVHQKGGKEFAFEADCWNSSFEIQVELKKIFRQSEANLVKLLQNVRRGETDCNDLDLLKKCCKEEPDLSMVQLYPRTQDVNRVNKKKMEDLKKPTYIYHAHDCGKDPWRRQLNQGIAPHELPLCEGARVMLCKNLSTSRKLVNGATGTVTEFCYEGVVVSELWKQEERPVVPMVKFDSGLEMIIIPETWDIVEGGEVVATRKQLPLILAWALSIHKCQGMTLDNLHTDLSRAFGFGMVYVALSRVRTLDGLHLSSFKPSKIKAHPKVLEFYERFSSKQNKQGGDIGVYKDKSGSSNPIHALNKTTHEESNNINQSLYCCKPNSSLVRWYNSISKGRGWG